MQSHIAAFEFPPITSAPSITSRSTDGIYDILTSGIGRKPTTPFIRPSSILWSSSDSSSSSSSNSAIDEKKEDEEVGDDHSKTQQESSPSESSGAELRQKLFMTLPRHESHEGVNEKLTKTENVIRALYADDLELECDIPMNEDNEVEGNPIERVFSNHYVDMGKVDTVGFDYDYTLATYTPDLLSLIYSMALKRLVVNHQYPPSLLTSNMTFSPDFSIRGLAVDRETGWICHLSYTHKVAVAFEGRKKVSRERLDVEYRGKRSLRPSERKVRLKPLNDLFSMAECCLIADVIQFFMDNDIPYCPRNAVVDILSAIGSTHISGDFHRLVAQNPGKYFEPRPHLNEVLRSLNNDGKRLILVSNSPFWYVDAGMRHVIGDDWKDVWKAIICSAGKPRFYTDDARPFRLVDKDTGQISFKKITRFKAGEVYAEGCLKELTKMINWRQTTPHDHTDPTIDIDSEPYSSSMSLTSSNVLYIGDSLFADLVDAKRDFGWTTAAVVPEVAWEIELQRKAEFTNSQHTIDLLLDTLRKIQGKMGANERIPADIKVIDSLEGMVSLWRKEQNTLLGNPFGSIFRAQYQPSLFAHSLRRYSDLYMSNVSDLRHYSPQHRFYPDDARLLSHEMEKVDSDCWDIF